jgi:hypothetical protein
VAIFNGLIMATSRAWNAELPHWVLGWMNVLLVGVAVADNFARWPNRDLVAFFDVPIAFLTAVAYLALYRKRSRLFSVLAWLTAATCGAIITLTMVIGFVGL